jgi:6-pyruvoyl-tetrahydropterin synthase
MQFDDDSFLDSISNRLKKINFKEEEIYEYEELLKRLELKKVSLSILERATERYNRYLEGIYLWNIDGICCLYIRNMIIDFVKGKNERNNMVQRFREMRKIDKEICNKLQPN